MLAAALQKESQARGTAKLLELLETGMAEMAKDGRLEAIYARYGIASP